MIYNKDEIDQLYIHLNLCFKIMLLLKQMKKDIYA